MYWIEEINIRREKMISLQDLQELPLGSTWRGPCFNCGKKDFTATNKEGTIVFNCYSISCNTKGKMRANLSIKDLKAMITNAVTFTRKEDVKSLPEYIRNAEDTDELYHSFKKQWQIEDLPTMIDVKDNRIVFPLRNEDAIGRLLIADRSKPKWLRYGTSADYFLLDAKDDCIIVVEDVISAYASYQVFGVASMALLGTNLTRIQIGRLAEFKRIIIALDPDAYEKAAEHKQSLILWTDLPVEVVNLEDDIKYRNELDIIKIEERIRARPNRQPS